MSRVVAVGSKEFTLITVSEDVWAPLTARRISTLVSFHQWKCGSVTVFFRALDVKAKIGLIPFGLSRKIISRKLSGRSEVPKSPVPLNPPMAGIVLVLSTYHIARHRMPGSSPSSDPREDPEAVEASLAGRCWNPLGNKVCGC